MAAQTVRAADAVDDFLLHAHRDGAASGFLFYGTRLPRPNQKRAPVTAHVTQPGRDLVGRDNGWACGGGGE
jgi:hypothetical protein